MQKLTSLLFALDDDEAPKTPEPPEPPEPPKTVGELVLDDATACLDVVAEGPPDGEEPTEPPKTLLELMLDDDIVFVDSDAPRRPDLLADDNDTEGAASDDGEERVQPDNPQLSSSPDRRPAQPIAQPSVVQQQQQYYQHAAGERSPGSFSADR